MRKSTFNIYMQIIIASNLFPIYSIYKYHWSLFSLIWLFWLESLIINVFECCKIIMAQKNENHKHFLAYKIKLAFKFFFIQLGILLFYLLFMVAFIGIKKNTETNLINDISIISFSNQIFNLAIVGFIISLFFQYAFFFIANKTYKKALPTNYFNFFSARTFVLHIVIVLGVISNEFLGKKLNLSSNTIFLIIFIVVKTIADIVVFKMNNKE